MTLLGLFVPADYELKVELQPLPPRSAVATANRIRDLLARAESEGWSPAEREDAILRAAIDLRHVLASASVDDFTYLVGTPPRLTGETRWGRVHCPRVVEDETATRAVSTPRWTDEKVRFTRPAWYLSENRARHAWERATAPGAFVRHGIFAAKEEMESV